MTSSFFKNCPKDYIENKFDQICMKCLINQYEETTQTGEKVCANCDEKCQTCIFKKDNCTSCSNDLYSFQGDCIKNCPISYFPSKEFGKCLPCHTTCNTCIGSSNNTCLSCNSNLFLFESSCVDKCPSGYYSDLNDRRCKKCHFTCQECIDGGESSCTGNCVQSREFKQNRKEEPNKIIGQCTCRTGYFESGSSNCSGKK